uniref:Uncharacterized protein n=1 Tax=Rhizophora mucronata TaxID=61149 RepID=A0A2P2R3G3_RHIMU
MRDATVLHVNLPKFSQKNHNQATTTTGRAKEL